MEWNSTYHFKKSPSARDLCISLHPDTEYIKMISQLGELLHSISSDLPVVIFRQNLFCRNKKRSSRSFACIFTKRRRATCGSDGTFGFRTSRRSRGFAPSIKNLRERKNEFVEQIHSFCHSFCHSPELTDLKSYLHNESFKICPQVEAISTTSPHCYAWICGC